MQVLREVIATRADLPVDVVTPESRLLRDLHLNSITVAHLVGEVAQRLGIPSLTAPTQFANASIAEVARALADLRNTGGAAARNNDVPAGVAEWVRTFAIEHVSEPFTKRSATAPRNVTVSLLGADGATAFERLRRAADDVRDGETLVVVQERPGGGGFARTLHLERPEVNVCVVNVDAFDDAMADRVADEAANAAGFVEVFYERGERSVPRLVPRDFRSAGEALCATDVLLVSGGGKGIAAESALHLARRSGAAVGIIGRSDPGASTELAANLERFRRHGVRVHYASADVTDAAAVLRAMTDIRDALGATTVVLHGAGTNEPALIEQLDDAQFRSAFEPKVGGLRNLLDCCDPDTPRLVIAFGSVIARTGMRGEAHYAFANEWLAAALDDFAAVHPGCRALTIEWSVWSGAGMGERLGRVEALRHEGITPIGVDDAVAILESLVASDARGSIVVAGRLGSSPTLRFRQPELPILRFLEYPRVAVDGIEIVADAQLTDGSDPYLGDHVFRGDALVPAVIGLEAMAQAATALRNLSLPLAFEDVDLRWPIVIGDGGATMRVAALAHGDSVDLVIRSSAMQFSVDHFRARIVRLASGDLERFTIPPTPLALDIDHDIYDALLFHHGRFRRIRSYRTLTAYDCVAEIAARSDAWFAPYRPSRLILGDPGVRDAAIHALQACIPHATVLPAAVGSIELLRPVPEDGSLFVHAHERARAGDHLIYDLAVTDDAGIVVERWRGLRLQVIETRATAPDLAPLLWAPYLERRLSELQQAPVRVTVNRESQWPRDTAELLVIRRPDGKPDATEGFSTSAAHAPDLTLTASSPSGIACDVESIVERAEADWVALLGLALLPLARAIAAEAKEDFAAAATRVWTAHECSQKRRGIAASTFTMLAADAGGAITLSSGADRITTFAIGNGAGQRLICSFLIDTLPRALGAQLEERRIS
jgi:enediyne polyketide synthase